MNTPHSDETKLLIGAKLCETRKIASSRQIIITLFGKSFNDLTPDEVARYRRLAKTVSYYRRHDQNKAQQRKDTSWKKLEILKVLGWDAACDACGYDKYIGALEFHHLDPTQKEGLVKTVEEARKCRLLCANCHREIQAGMPSGRGGRPVGPLDPLLVPYMRLSGLTDAQIDRAVAGRPDNGLAASSKVITLSSEQREAHTALQHSLPKIVLSKRDQKVFVDAMLNPEPPNDALKKAVKRSQTTMRPNSPTLDMVGVETKPGLTPGKTSTWLVNR